MTPTMWWFDAKMTAMMTRRLVAAGPGARIEFRHPETAPETLEWRVVAAEVNKAAFAEAEGEDCEEWFNHSHQCPPDCP